MSKKNLASFSEYIDSIPPEVSKKYRLLMPLFVEIRGAGNQWTVTWVEGGFSGSGKTQEEATKDFMEAFVEEYEELRVKEEKGTLTSERDMTLVKSFSNYVTEGTGTTLEKDGIFFG